MVSEGQKNYICFLGWNDHWATGLREGGSIRGSPIAEVSVHSDLQDLHSGR